MAWLIGSPSSGSLYPTLRALESDGLVTVEVTTRQDRPPRKAYTITDLGRSALREWANRPTGSMTLKAFTMRLMLASNMPRSGLAAHLEQRRSAVGTHAGALRQLLAGLGETDDVGESLAVDYGLAIAQAELAWLDRALSRLGQASLSEQVTGGANASAA